MQEAENTRLVQEGFAAFGRGDIETLLGYYADDIVFHPAYGTASYVPTSGVRTGKPAVVEFFKTLAETVTFSSFEVEEFIATGDKVVAFGHYAGTTSVGKTIETDFAMVTTLKDGKITHFKEFCDSAAINAGFAVAAGV